MFEDKKMGTKKQGTLINTAFENLTISVITLEVNGLNALIKRLSGRINEQDLPICCLQKNPTLYIKTHID